MLHIPFVGDYVAKVFPIPIFNFLFDGFQFLLEYVHLISRGWHRVVPPFSHLFQEF